MNSVVKTQNTSSGAELVRLTTMGLFHFLVIVTPFLFTWVNDELFEFNKMLAVYALGGLIVASWLVRMVLSQRLIWKRTPLDIPIAAFLLSQIISTVFSIHPHTSLWGYYSRFHGGLASTITYILLYYAAVNTFSVREFKRLWWSVIIGAVASAWYAIPEHFGHSPSCWLITNGQQFNVDCWIQDVKSRVFGTFGQPNWLAAYDIMVIPLCLAMFGQATQSKTSSSRSTLPTWVWLVGGASSVASLLLATLYTQSRSGILGLGVGLAALVAGWLVWLWRSRQPANPLFKDLNLVGASLLAVIVAICLGVGTQFTPSLASLLTKAQNTTGAVPTAHAAPTGDRLSEGGTDSGDIRKIVWTGALRVWRRYPIFGSGVETFAYSYYLDRPVEHNLVSEWDFLYNKAHNEFLNFLATTGLVGLGTYVILLGTPLLLTVWRVWQPAGQPPLKPSSAALLLSYASGTVAVSISNFFGFSTVMVTVVWYLFLAGFTLIWSEQSDSVNHHKNMSDTGDLQVGQWLGLAAIGLVAIWWVWLVRTQWQADYDFSQGKNLIKAGSLESGLFRLEQASRELPDEALYYDELAATYGEVAAALSLRQEATLAAQVAQSAVSLSDQALKLNNRHLNFYKTRARLFLTLADMDPQFLLKAKDTLTKARELSPTDAKLVYNLGLVELSLGHGPAGAELLQTAIQLKPNYESARAELGNYYATQKKWAAAAEQYQAILRLNPNNQLVQSKLDNLQASHSAELPSP